MRDFQRLCIHTITNKPWTIEECAENYAREGIAGITVWRNTLERRNISKTGTLLRNYNLRVVSLCRGGFFPSVERSKRLHAIKDNIKAIDEAAALGAPLVVLVCGSDPAQSLEESRSQIKDGILAVIGHAEKNKIKLAIEPLHPMYADTRSAISTIKQANDMAEEIRSPWLGVAVDVYHLWWDPDLEKEIRRCGDAGKLFAFHISDWRSPTRDLLNDRGLMGEGCIPVKKIREWVESTGFKGFNEVEIFSDVYWSGDQKEFLQKIKYAYIHHS
jgi:sugar phosphate isomerase/epimerase